MPGRNHAERLLDDGGHLVPVDGLISKRGEHHPHPSREDSTARRGWPEESFGLGHSQFLGDSRWGGTPERGSIITVMVIVEVADRPPVSNEKAGGPVAQPFGDLRQPYGDL